MNSYVYNALILGLCLSSQSVVADNIGGVPLADFSTNKLIIPCVLVKDLDEAIDGQYYDVELVKTDDAFNYQLSFAEVEDSSLCQRVSDFAVFEDDDFEEDSSGDGNEPKILVSCEKRSDRSRVSVDGRNLTSGSYAAVVRSGFNNEAQSLSQAPIGGEVEFDFDSDVGDIAAGATLIGPDFIQDGAVSADLINADSDQVLVSASVNCEIK